MDPHKKTNLAPKNNDGPSLMVLLVYAMKISTHIDCQAGIGERMISLTI